MSNYDVIYQPEVDKIDAKFLTHPKGLFIYNNLALVSSRYLVPERKIYKNVILGDFSDLDLDL